MDDDQKSKMEILSNYLTSLNVIKKVKYSNIFRTFLQVDQNINEENHLKLEIDIDKSFYDLKIFSLFIQKDIFFEVDIKYIKKIYKK